MTRLLSDLTDIAALHGHQHADASVLVPIGAIRAAVTMLGRYEGWQMADREVLPEWMHWQIKHKLPGAKNMNMALARREMAGKSR